MARLERSAGVYLFLDGHEKEGVLSAYAVLEDGRPVLVHLDVGRRESYDAWLSFLQDLVARGLRDPLRVVMDGAPGLVKAVKRVWPHAYRQRCQVHKMRNILAKLPRLMQAKMKELVQQVFLAPSYAVALNRGRDLIAKFKDRYPAAPGRTAAHESHPTLSDRALLLVVALRQFDRRFEALAWGSDDRGDAPTASSSYCLAE